MPVPAPRPRARPRPRPEPELETEPLPWPWARQRSSTHNAQRSAVQPGCSCGSMKMHLTAASDNKLDGDRQRETERDREPGRDREGGGIDAPKEKLQQSCCGNSATWGVVGWEKCCRLPLSSSILKAAIHFRFVSSSSSSSRRSSNNCNCNCRRALIVAQSSTTDRNFKQIKSNAQCPLATATVAAGAAAAKALPALLNVNGRRQRCRQSAMRKAAAAVATADRQLAGEQSD